MDVTMDILWKHWIERAAMETLYIRVTFPNRIMGRREGLLDWLFRSVLVPWIKPIVPWMLVSFFSKSGLIVLIYKFEIVGSSIFIIVLIDIYQT